MPKRYENLITDDSQFMTQNFEVVPIIEETTVAPTTEAVTAGSNIIVAPPASQ